MRQILAVFFVLAVAANARGQEILEGVSFSVDLLNLAAAGADINQVEVFTMRQTLSEGGTLTQRTTRLDYGTDFRRIEMKIGTNQALSWRAGYRRGNWGVSFRRWSTEGDASYSERVSSSPVRLTSTAGTTTGSQDILGCRMWDNTQAPVLDVREASGFSPVDCHARNELHTSKMDVMLERAWIDNPNVQATVRIGAAIARLEHRREEGQEQNSFLEVPGGQTPFGPSFDRFVNRITLDSTGEATGRLVGPGVELAGSFGFGRLQADWRLNQSVVIGDVNLTSEWIDIDRINITGRVGNVSFTESELLEGRYPHSEEKRTAIPVLDSEVKVGYRIVRTFSAGVGFFISSWQAAPLASSWSVPGEWTDSAGTHWQRNESDLVFHGVTLFAQMSF